MRNLLLNFLLAALFGGAGHAPQPEASSSFPVKEIVASDARLRFSNGVLFYNAQPFSGVLVESYPDGQAKSKAEYQLGKKHGIEWMWYPTGKIYWKRQYQNGEKHGLHQGWWSNGQRKFLYHFVNGQNEGVAQDWYENGQLFKSQNYVQGEEAGVQKAWRENGKLYVNYVMKNGKRYGLFNSRLCYKFKDGLAQY